MDTLLKGFTFCNNDNDLTKLKGKSHTYIPQSIFNSLTK